MASYGVRCNVSANSPAAGCGGRAIDEMVEVAGVEPASSEPFEGLLRAHSMGSVSVEKGIDTL